MNRVRRARRVKRLGLCLTCFTLEVSEPEDDECINCQRARAAGALERDDESLGHVPRELRPLRTMPKRIEGLSSIKGKRA